MQDNKFDVKNVSVKFLFNFSQAVIADNTIYVSGQIPLHPETGEMVEGGIKEQAEQVHF